MKSVDCVAPSAERFCALMNMPPIPKSAPHSAHNKALLKAAKEVCFETVSDAARKYMYLKIKVKVK